MFVWLVTEEDSTVVPLCAGGRAVLGGGLTLRLQEVVQILRPAQQSACTVAFGAFNFTLLRKLRSQHACPPVVPARRGTRSGIDFSPFKILSSLRVENYFPFIAIEVYKSPNA